MKRETKFFILWLLLLIVLFAGAILISTLIPMNPQEPVQPDPNHMNPLGVP